MNRFCMDSSGVLDGWIRYYPPIIIPSLELCFDQLASEKRLLIPQEVAIELIKKDDGAAKWIRRMKICHVAPNKDIQDAVTTILEQFPKLTGQGGNRSGADPFVIATAMVRDAVVVTGEDKGGPKNPKIPWVCEQLGLKCMSFTELIIAEGWQFIRHT
jgi:hypothetical protein